MDVCYVESMNCIEFFVNLKLIHLKSNMDL